MSVTAARLIRLAVETTVDDVRGVDGDIVFRTRTESALAVAAGTTVGFEADRIDEAMTCSAGISRRAALDTGALDWNRDR